MPLSFSVETDDERVTRELTKIARELDRPRRLMAAAGKQLEVDLKKHFLSREREPNKKGWPSLHFWKKEGHDKTALQTITDNSATVVIASPAIAHKQEGGRIVPKRGQALAIPLTPEAARTGSPSLFPRGLTMIQRPGRPPLLIDKNEVKTTRVKAPDAKRKTRRLIVESTKRWIIQYVLVKSVWQDRDPKTLPPFAKLAESIIRRARALVGRLLPPSE